MKKSTICPVIDLANKIKSRAYPTVKVAIDPFYIKTINGEMIPNPDTRVQVREEYRNLDRVDLIYNKVRQSEDYSKLEPITIVQFPGAITKLVGGAHTLEVEQLLGWEETDAYSVDFIKDLGGIVSNVTRLGNLLNQHEVNRESVSLDDIKKEFYQRIEENGEKLSDAQKREFILVYPEVTMHTIGNWQAHHAEVGGRKKPRQSYTTKQLADLAKAFGFMQRYAGYAICTPRTLRSWRDTGYSAAFQAMQEKGVKKALVVLYCETSAMVESWKSGYGNTISEEYAKMNQHFDVTIEYEMIQYE